MLDPTRYPVPPFPQPGPNPHWHDDLKRWGLKPMHLAAMGTGMLTYQEPDGEPELLKVETVAQVTVVERHVLDDEPMLRATLRDQAYLLAECAASHGKRYIGNPSTSVVDATPWPERIPDPWWRRVLIRLGLAEPRYTTPTRLYALRTEVRAA